VLISVSSDSSAIFPAALAMNRSIPAETAAPDHSVTRNHVAKENAAPFPWAQKYFPVIAFRFGRRLHTK
jgi:hypothetical protein